MIQIGPLKYIKEEESTVMASILSGVLVGIPIGWVLSFSAGLLERLTSVPTGADWTLTLLGAGWIFLATCWAIAIMASVLVSKRNRFDSKKVGKMVFGTVLIPLAWMLALLVTGLVAAPIDAFLYTNFGIAHTYAIDVLVLSPFAVLSVAIVIPDSRPGKALRRLIRPWRRHAQKTNA